MTPKERQCCDEIIVVRTKQEEIAEDVKDLKKLYEPVQKLKTIFYILSFFTAIMITLAGFLWRDSIGLQKEMHLNYTELIKTINDYNKNISEEFYTINLSIAEMNLKNTKRELDYLKQLTDKENEKGK
jgi:hypothetical protein